MHTQIAMPLSLSLPCFLWFAPSFFKPSLSYIFTCASSYFPAFLVFLFSNIFLLFTFCHTPLTFWQLSSQISSFMNLGAKSWGTHWEKYEQMMVLNMTLDGISAAYYENLIPSLSVYLTAEGAKKSKHSLFDNYHKSMYICQPLCVIK